MKKHLWRAAVESAFIIFLFYSNLLMGEFEGSGLGRRNGLLWALRDIFTPPNFGVALVAALAGHFIFEYLRRIFSEN